MKKPSKKNGWRAYIFDWAPWASIVIAGLIVGLGDVDILRHARVDIGIAMVGMSSALLGIVLAGLAIFIAFLDRAYAELLEEAVGLEANLTPFKHISLVAIICAALGMTLIIIGKPTDVVFQTILGLSLAAFAYLLWQFFEIVRYLCEHAKTRFLQIRIEMEKRKQAKDKTP